MSIKTAHNLVVLARSLVEASGGLYSRLAYCLKNWPDTFLDVLHIALVQTGVPVGADELKDPEAYLKEHEAELSKSYPWDKYLGWIAKELRKELGSDDYMELVGFFLSKFDTFLAKVRKGGVDISKLKLRDVFEELGSVSGLTPPSQGEVVQKFPDGWTLQKLTTDRQLADESELMSHCVKTYCQKVKDGTSRIFSLRDPKGFPHVTLEQNKEGELIQIQAKGNAFPKKHLDRLMTSVETTFGGDFKGKLLLLRETMNPTIWGLLDSGVKKNLFPTKPDLGRALKVPNDEPTSEKLGFMTADWACRVVAPLALDAEGFKDVAAKLRALKPIVDKATAYAANAAAYVAARAAAYVAARAAYAAAYAAARAADAADAASRAADAASWAIQAGASKTLIQGSLMDLFDRMCEVRS